MGLARTPAAAVGSAVPLPRPWPSVFGSLRLVAWILLALVAAGWMGGTWMRAHARAERRGAAAPSSAFAIDDRAIPDEGVLREQLEEAIELRRREDYDRMLDARDPG